MMALLWFGWLFFCLIFFSFHSFSTSSCCLSFGQQSVPYVPVETLLLRFYLPGRISRIFLLPRGVFVLVQGRLLVQQAHRITPTAADTLDGIDRVAIHALPLQDRRYRAHPDTKHWPSNRPDKKFLRLNFSQRQNRISWLLWSTRDILWLDTRPKTHHHWLGPLNWSYTDMIRTISRIKWKWKQQSRGARE